MDEMIEIIRGLTLGEFFSYQGKHYQIREHPSLSRAEAADPDP